MAKNSNLLAPSDTFLRRHLGPSEADIAEMLAFLGLDSLDAVELVVLVQKYFDVQIVDMDEGKIAFESINSLAAFISDRKK